MFTLFEVMTLDSWSGNVRPMLHTRFHVVLFFVVFIITTAFFLLNLVTAVVVDRTVAAQEEVDNMVENEQRKQRFARIKLICGILRQTSSAADPDVLSRKDFQYAVDNVDELREVLFE